MSRTHTPITDELAAYIRRVTLREPEPLKRLREETENHPRASMQTAPEQGQFLHLLARILGAKKTLEVGVFMGYSSTWVAMALPAAGKIVACDISEEYTSRARLCWRETGVERKIDLRLGPAIETLDSLIAEGQAGSFDFAFIDVDNVLWNGSVIDAGVHDADTEAIRAFNHKLHADERVALSMVPLGDGLTLACKL